VTSLWADERHYYPLHVEPYTPAARLAGGKQDAAFRTKPQIALALIEKARAAGIPFRAIVADCFYGDNDGLATALREHRLPYVLARRGSAGGGWAPAAVAHTFKEAAREVPPGAWQPVERRFRDGHAERWWAAELTLAGHGPGKRGRAICATTDRGQLPEISTWYLTTNLAREEVPLAEIVRLYGLRNWVEQSYKQMKDELGWSDFMVRSDRAIRRHWALVCCAFCFCWWQQARRSRVSDAAPQPALPPAQPAQPSAAREKNRHRPTAALAPDAALGAGLAGPGALARTLLERVFRQAPVARARHTDGGIDSRSRH
jgi:SRSO17 transposase